MHTPQQTISKHAIPGFTLLPRDGYYQVRKIGLTAERVKKDPAFKNTRRLAREFATVVKLSKSIAEALLPRTGVKKMAPRLNSALMKAVQADTVHLPGSRNLLYGDWQALQELDLNHQSAFKNACQVQVACHYNPQTWEIKVQLPAMIPAIQMDPPPGFTHYRILSTIINIDAQYIVAQAPWQQSTLFPVKAIKLPPVQKIFKINNENQWLNLVVLFIEWYRQSAAEDKPGWTKMPGPLHIAELYKTECYGNVYK